MMDSQQKAVAEEFDGYHESYAQTVDDAIGVPGLKVDFFTRVKADYFVDILDRELGSAKENRVLDIGCGIGLYHDYLLPKVKGLSGVDVSISCVEQATQANPNVDYETYDGSRLPYEDNSFDAAVTVCVLHHVPQENWIHFLEEMQRVIKPGGLAIVFEHNPYNPVTMNIVNRCPFDADAVLLKPKVTLSMMRDVKFSEIKSRFILSIPAANKFLRGCDRLFSRLPFGAQYYAMARKPSM